MGTNYTLDGYYNISFQNGKSFFVKNIDVKQDIHTDYYNCFTINDNSIVEFWVNNDFKYLDAGISKHTDYGYVTKIERRDYG